VSAQPGASASTVIPAKAGIQSLQRDSDPRAAAFKASGSTGVSAQPRASASTVIPAKAGIQSLQRDSDPRAAAFKASGSTR